MIVHKGTLKGFVGRRSSQIAFLFIDDTRRGIMPIPCEILTTLGALRDAFNLDIPTLGGGMDYTFPPEYQKEIYWSWERGRLTGFTIVETAPQDIKEAYERRKIND